MKAIITCENKQELDDLLYLIEKSAGEIDPIYFDMSKTLGTSKLEGSERVGTTIESLNPFSEKFKNLSPLKKIITSLINAILLAIIYKKYKSDVLISGTPLLTIRMAKIITLGKIKTAVIIRGIIAHSSNETSTSSNFFLKTKKFARTKIAKIIISDYYGDIVFCTGEVTKNFIKSRLVPEENIVVAGSLYCDRQPTAANKNNTEKLIVFIPSALSFHGYHDAQQLQTKLIEDILQEFKSATQGLCKIQIRKHPRENIEIYQSNPILIDHLDCTLPPINSYPENTLFISPISTLAFELAYQKKNSHIVTTAELQDKFCDWYSSMGVQNKFNWKELIEKYLNGEHIAPMREIEEIISTENRGMVANKIISETKSRLRIS